MTADGTGVRRPVIPANEERRLDEYGPTSSLSEADLALGYNVRLRLLGVPAGPACRLKHPKGKCACQGEP